MTPAQRIPPMPDPADTTEVTVHHRVDFMTALTAGLGIMTAAAVVGFVVALIAQSLGGS